MAAAAGALTFVLGAEAFEFFGGSRPVGAEEARKGSVREKLSRSLADRTIVGLVGGVADTLDLRIAVRA